MGTPGSAPIHGFAASCAAIARAIAESLPFEQVLELYSRLKRYGLTKAKR